jgi:GTP cyclohydrolase I
MKIDMSDDNVMEDLSSGNIGTPGRIAKVWMGANLDDDRELGGGRWSRKPRLASFPNTNDTNIPITKRVDIISNCSHHFIPFTTIAREESYAIISYIPDKFVLGISKLQRLADWVSQRFFLQEDLTKKLYEAVSEASQTDSVYVGLFNMVHGCESMRGAKSNDGSFTSEYYGGKFADPELRKQIRS